MRRTRAGESRNAYNIVTGKTKDKGIFGIARRKYEIVNWINLASDRLSEAESCEHRRVVYKRRGMF